MTLDVAAMATAGVVGGLGGLLVPGLITRLPEPTPLEAQAEGETEDEDHRILREEGPKELFAHLGARPGLRLGATMASILGAGAIGLRVGFDPFLVALVAMVPLAVALAVVDWQTRLLPLQVLTPAYTLVVVVVLVVWALTGDTGDVVRSGWGWLLYGGTYFALWFVYPRGLGYGDVRLAGVLGILLGHLGWAELVVGIYGGTLLGGILGALLSLVGVVHHKGVPFGPFMVAGALLGIVAGAPVIGALGY